MTPLQKIELVKQLKAAISDAKSLDGLKRLDEIKRVMQLRADLGLSVKSDNSTSQPNQVSKVIKGRSNNVKTAKGTRVSTILAVTEIDNVIASHTASGSQNPIYPQELQPRDRGRDSSVAWVQKVSRDLDPESLGRSGRADSGAPIVGDDMAVESGNGRTMAIAMAYNNGTAGNYRDWLIDEADYLGFSPKDVEAFKRPILIRIRTSEVDRVKFAIEANQDDKLSYSATERAKTDAKMLDDHMLMLFNPSENGDLTAASNHNFVVAFLKQIGDTEAAQYTTKDGKPTQALVARMKAAIFSKAYNDERLTEMMADDAKPELQNVLNALSVAAPKFIEAQAISRGNVQDISSGIVDSIEKGLDDEVTNAIIDAANVVMSAKENNHDVAEYVKQLGLFNDMAEGVAEIAVFIATNNRSAKKMGLFFRAMAEFCEKESQHGLADDLFGSPPVSTKDAANYAVDKVQSIYGNDKGLDMFDSMTLTPLEKLKKIKELKSAVSDAKELGNLQKLQALKKIMQLRKDLGLVSNKENETDYLGEQVKSLSDKVSESSFDPLGFDSDFAKELAGKIEDADRPDLAQIFKDTLEHYRDLLVSLAIKSLQKTKAIV
ncbi:hypothetical protein [Psychrobacter sanguinis]|uniref:hypothetical protein n=1 Tax=Psychrobacter sanguinis TaxID=861445 RepID=UPI0019185370|nr:hypothetical protein [Psychrobacter sanguinis]UEC24884.1 hypothetical protein LK453_10075 [Psychrobacter sanguinis]